MIYTCFVKANTSDKNALIENVLNSFSYFLNREDCFVEIWQSKS